MFAIRPVNRASARNSQQIDDLPHNAQGTFESLPECVYCQNYTISQQGNSVEHTPGELACQMLWLQEQGCHNLNLLTPAQFMPPLVTALRSEFNKSNE